METQPEANHQFTNRNAIVSFVAGLLTLLSLCTAVIPIPFTGYVCFPGAAVWSVVAVASGLRSIHQMRSSGERGTRLAGVGLALGGLTLSIGLCVVVVALAMWPRLVEVMRSLLN
jgi:hypothetical protein